MEMKFYLVWNCKTGYTKYKHANYNDAKKEAERLALENEGDTFYILHAIEKCNCKRVDWEELSDIQF